MAHRGIQEAAAAPARVFAYCRVSTADQTTDNQLKEITGAGFAAVQPQRIITETISGSVEAKRRPAFSKLLDKMEAGDILVVTKLDRLGRNAMDVRATVEHLEDKGIRVHCLALGGADLTSSAGKLVMQVLGAVAEFERDLLIERTQSGLQRAKAQGKHLGRRFSLTEAQREEVLRRIHENNGEDSISAIARDLNTSRQTILRVKAMDRMCS